MFSFSCFFSICQKGGVPQDCSSKASVERLVSCLNNDIVRKSAMFRACDATFLDSFLCWVFIAVLCTAYLSVRQIPRNKYFNTVYKSRKWTAEDGVLTTS